jgi:hypothetical protein
MVRDAAARAGDLQPGLAAASNKSPQALLYALPGDENTTDASEVSSKNAGLL